ncbi:hypothetical protein GCM10027614_07340 [Micromonospora vulcania]
MPVVDVAVAGVTEGLAAVVAAVRVDQAGRVLVLDVLRDPAGVGQRSLTPALVVRGVRHDGGGAAVLVDDLACLGLELRLLGVGGVDVLRGHRRDVLPDQQAESVGVVEPALRLDLDVLAHHVEAEVLVLLQVEGEGGVGRRGIQAVRPEALVQGADLEHELPVELGPQHPVHHAGGDLAHPEVVRGPVDGRTAGVAQGDPQVVEERVVG